MSFGGRESGSTTYPSPSPFACAHKYTDICDAIGLLALKCTVVVERLGLLHIHFLMDCVHKCMDIYDGIGL